MLILYGPNGEEIECVEYRWSIGFVKYLIPIDEESEPECDCISGMCIEPEDDE